MKVLNSYSALAEVPLSDMTRWLLDEETVKLLGLIGIDPDDAMIEHGNLVLVPTVLVTHMAHWIDSRGARSEVEEEMLEFCVEMDVDDYADQIEMVQLERSEEEGGR